MTYRVFHKYRRDDSVLASVIRIAAAKGRVSAATLAQHAGITTGVAAAILSGKKKPHRAALTRAAQALSVDHTDFGKDSSKFYVDFTDHIGVPRRIPATSDKHSSTEFARRLELLVNARRVRSTLTPEVTHWVRSLPEPDFERLVALDLVDLSVRNSSADARRVVMSVSNSDKSSKIVKNTLSTKERYLLTKWIESNLEMFREKRLTQDEAALAASTDLKFKVSAANISSIASESEKSPIYFTWRTTVHRAARRASTEQLLVLTSEIHRLLERLGEKPSPEFQDMYDFLRKGEDE